MLIIGFFCKKTSQMGPCVVMCVRESETIEAREKRYVETDLPVEISKELAKSEPPPVHPTLEPLEISDTTSVQPEVEQQTPQAESKLNNKSRFYKEKHDPSDQLQTLTFGEAGESVEQPEAVLNKKTQKREDQCLDILGSTEFSEVSITDSLINGDGKGSRLSDLGALEQSKIIDKPIILQGAAPADQLLIDSTLNFSVPTHLSSTVTFTNRTSYQGQWQFGLPHGVGSLTQFESVQEGGREDAISRQQSSYGNVYVGEFQRGMFSGEGTLVSECGLSYRGKWVSGKREGFGVEEWKNGQKYEGEWRHNKKNGYGELYFEDGSYYKGSFVHNELQGEGEYSWYCKKIYKGSWLHNQMSGKGVLLWENGTRYEGEFKHDKMHGKGRQINSEGVLFEGEWENGRKTGIIMETNSNGEKKRGEWYFGKVIRYIDEERWSRRASKISTFTL